MRVILRFSLTWVLFDRAYYRFKTGDIGTRLGFAHRRVVCWRKARTNFTAHRSEEVISPRKFIRRLSCFLQLHFSTEFSRSTRDSRSDMVIILDYDCGGGRFHGFMRLLRKHRRVCPKASDYQDLALSFVILIGVTLLPKFRPAIPRLIYLRGVSGSRRIENLRLRK